MRRNIVCVLLVAVGLGIVTAPALAGKSGGSGANAATIAFANPDNSSATTAPSAGGTVYFAVTSKLAGRQLLVVTNRCWRDGAVVYNQYSQVVNGLAGPFTVNLESPGPVNCEAFVWAYPNMTTPLSGGYMTYKVS
jgi:hypothetical protein